MTRLLLFLKKSVLELSVILLAFLLRVWNIASPSRFVMDERYYVVESNSVLKRGYETYQNSDFSVFALGGELKKDFEHITSFIGGNADYFSWHPPLGKLMISAGMGIFGVDNPLGWRVMSVLFGTGVVALVMWLAFLVFRNKFVSVAAGLLIAVDGLAIALSRVGMLDIFLTFFSLLGFIFLTVYLQARIAANSKNAFKSMILMSVFFGLATGVKWSGLYFYAAAVIIVLIFEIYMRKKNNVTVFNSVLFFVKKMSYSLLFFISAYVLAWVPYLVFYAVPRNGFIGGVQNFFLQHVVILQNAQSINSVHNFKSKAIEWVFASHPSLMFVQNNLSTGEFIGISSMPNLILWISSIVAFFVLIILLLRKKVTSFAWILIAAVVFAWVPWIVMTERTVYQYYTVIFEPYLYIILAYVLYKVWARDKDLVGKILVVFFLGVVLLYAVFAYPGASGMVVSKDHFSHALFNYWTNLNVDLGLYDLSQIENKEFQKR